MDAVGFLAERKWPPAGRVALLLLLGTGSSGLSVAASIWLPERFPELLSHPLIGLLWGLFIPLAGLVCMLSLLGLWLLVPMFSVVRAARTLHRWTRGRRVEEMMQAGIPPSLVLDTLARKSLLWWWAVSWPSLLVSLVFLSLKLQGVWLWTAFAGWLLGVLGLAALGLYFAAWTGARRPGGAAVLASLLLVLGVPGLGLLVAGGQAWAWLAAALYLVTAARWSALFALRAAAGEPSRRRGLAPPTPRRLPENAIAARERLRGESPGAWPRRGLLALAFALTTAAVLVLRATWLYAFLLAGGLLVTGYAAAARMSRALAEEEEAATLSSLRSTSLTSGDYLQGWLVTILREYAAEGVVLVAAVTLALVGLRGPLQQAASPLFLALALALLLPLAGASLGAFLGSSGRTRQEISAQVMILYGAVTAVAGPQFLAASGMMGLGLSLFLLLLGAGVLCGVLGLRTRRNLDRIFLP